MKRILSIALMVCHCFFLEHSALGQNSPDELDAYVQKLKASKAAFGPETAFMSIGSDFLYAQEYFEAKNYSSAAYSFKAIVQRQPDHAFANYQLGIALLQQNDPEKTKEAKQYLDRAFALNPGLKDRFAREVPSEKVVLTDKSITTVPAPKPSAAPAGLAAYIARIKHSYATGGQETQMLSAGQEAHAGIEYYETGEFGSAETRFALSLAKDPQNPYVNYLAAVSLAAQGKTQAAQPYYQKALAGDAALAKQYAPDVTTAKAKWTQKQETKLVKTTPAPKVTYGGALTYGKYTCHQSIWNGPNTSPAYRFDYKGYFDLRKDGTYRWLDNGGTGRYSYNAKTGAITWLSGPMKTQAPKSSKLQNNTTMAQVTVEFSENYRWECGCKK